MKSIRTIVNVTLAITFLAVSLGATVAPARAEDWDRDHRDEHKRDHERRDYYPPHREYYVQPGYYPPPPPVVLMPPPVVPEFNLVIPLGR